MKKSFDSFRLQSLNTLISKSLGLASLTLITISLSEIQARAAVIVSNLPFSTTGQSIWGAGLNAQYRRTDSFNQNLDINFDTRPPVVPIELIQSPLVFDGSVSGQVEVGYDFFASTGTADVEYPVQTNIVYPNVATEGSIVTFESGFNPLDGGSLQAFSPQLEAKVNLLYDQISAEVGVTIGEPFFDERFSLVSIPPTSGKLSLFNIGASSPEFSEEFPGDFGEVTGSLPEVDINQSFDDGVLSGSGRDTFASIDVDAIQIAALEPRLRRFLEPLSGERGFEAGPLELELEYEIVSVPVDLSADFEQFVEFQPELKVRYQTETGEEQVANVGEALSFNIPENFEDESLSVTATYFLDSSLQSQANIILNPGIGVSFLEGEIELEVEGSDLEFELPYGPLVEGRESLFDIISLPVFNDTVPLEGFETFEETFEIAIVEDLEAATIEGSSSGTFLNPVPTSAVYTGFGTGSITWGSPFFSSSSSATYTGKNFSVITNEIFEIGEFSYSNESIALGTGITNATLELNVPFSISELNIEDIITEEILLTVNETPNIAGDPLASSDFFSFEGTTFRVNEGDSATASVLARFTQNSPFNLEIMGFGRVIEGNGFIASEGELPLNPSPKQSVPEPSSILGLFMFTGIGILVSIKSLKKIEKLEAIANHH